MIFWGRQNIAGESSLKNLIAPRLLIVMGSSSDNNNINNRAVENQCSNYIFLDNVQFHLSLVDRVKELSSNDPLVAPSHRNRKVLDRLLKELVDSDDEGFVTKVRKCKCGGPVDN